MKLALFSISVGLLSAISVQYTYTHEPFLHIYILKMANFIGKMRFNENSSKTIFIYGLDIM